MEPKSEPSQHLGYAVLSLWILGAVLSDEETKLNKVGFSVNSESVWETDIGEVQFCVTIATGQVQTRHS